MKGRLLAALLAAGAAVSAPAVRALEPRFDHRDEAGPSVEVGVSSDTVNARGEPGATGAVASVRLAWSFDVAGEGSELVTGLRYAGFGTHGGGERIRWAADTRYRAFFGTEEWKTFLDFGLWGSFSTRIAAGPLVGMGVVYDWSRGGGVYAAASLATALGQAREVSLGVAVGLQLRFE